MATPTKKAIIGTCINGRNAQDDFLQLATNHGGTVFGWIDAAGHLQGSLLSGAGTPGGSDTDIQFNDGGILGGSGAFTFNKTTDQFVLTQGNTLTPVGLSVVQGAGLGTNYDSRPALSEFIITNELAWNMVFANASAPGNAGSTRQDFISIEQPNVGGGSINWYHAGVGYFFIDGTGTSEVDIGASGGTNLAIGVFGLDDISVTEIQFKHDGPINLVVQDGGIGNVDYAFAKTTSTWKNFTAATSLANANSPALVMVGQAWLGVSPSSVTRTYTIQEKDGNLQFTSAGSQQPVFPYQFDNSLQVTGAIQSSNLQANFSTGSAGTVYTLTAAGNASTGLTTYTGTITAGQQPVNGQTITIAGFVAHAANNGTFVVQSATLTTIVVYNSSGVAETQAATGTLNTSYFSNNGFGAYLGLTTLIFPIQGTSYAPNNSFAALPNTPLLTMSLKGEATDAAYLRIINDGSTGNHGLEIGSIIDGTGTTPVTIQLGHFGGVSAALFSNTVNAPTLIESATHTPSSAGDTGTTGQIAWDASFIYICTATNTWKRVGIATW